MSRVFLQMWEHGHLRNCVNLVLILWLPIAWICCVLFRRRVLHVCLYRRNSSWRNTGSPQGADGSCSCAWSETFNCIATSNHPAGSESDAPTFRESIPELDQEHFTCHCSRLQRHCSGRSNGLQPNRKDLAGCVYLDVLLPLVFAVYIGDRQFL